MENIVFYGLCLVMAIIGFWLVKRFVSCLLRSVIAIIIIALVAYAYFVLY